MWETFKPVYQTWTGILVQQSIIVCYAFRPAFGCCANQISVDNLTLFWCYTNIWLCCDPVLGPTPFYLLCLAKRIIFLYGNPSHMLSVVKVQHDDKWFKRRKNVWKWLKKYFEQLSVTRSILKLVKIHIKNTIKNFRFAKFQWMGKLVRKFWMNPFILFKIHNFK